MKDAAGKEIDPDAASAETEELYRRLEALVRERPPSHVGVFVNATMMLLLDAVMFSDDPGQLAEHLSKKLVEYVAAGLKQADSPSATRQ